MEKIIEASSSNDVEIYATSCRILMEFTSVDND